jgi:hypothetical protein
MPELLSFDRLTPSVLATPEGLPATEGENLDALHDGNCVCPWLPLDIQNHSGVLIHPAFKSYVLHTIADLGYV